MSFLNPVNEAVLRFKSTDASAPQINYNSRVAGDVKAVLKACLVTGYGVKPSAGWTAMNEVSHVAEFVSPGAAMSDYRIGIDDTSASSTTWYYQYQNARTNPVYNSPTKSFTYADKTHASNGWQLFVTERGLIFIEIVQHTGVNKLSTRITYFGHVKSAVTDSGSKNICFFNIGHNGGIAIPPTFYDSSTGVHINLSTNTAAYISSATTNMLSTRASVFGASNVDLTGCIYIASLNRDALLGELPGLLSKSISNASDVYGVTDSMLDARNVLSICAGYATSSADTSISWSRTFLIRTDYWEY